MKPQDRFQNNPMPKITEWENVIKSYEVGSDSSALHGSLMNYLEEVAVLASNNAGFSNEWIMERGYLWIIRKWHVQYFEQARYQDLIRVKSWVSNFRRVQSYREYDMRRDDGTPILRAKANWVFVEQDSFRPTRFPPEFESAYGPLGPTGDVITSLANGIATPKAPQHDFSYRARFDEIDRAQHVNNAHYIRWAEDAAYQYLRQLGISITPSQIRSHEMEYRNGAQCNDTIQVRNQLQSIDQSQILIAQQFFRHTTGQENEQLIVDNLIRIELSIDDAQSLDVFSIH